MSAAIETEDYTPDVGVVSRLNKDLREASKTLTDDEARYLVDLYYTTQQNRIRAAAQMREASDQGEPNGVLQWAFYNFKTTEDGVRSALHLYVKTKRVGEWLLSIHGIGPVIAAGMLAHLQVDPWKCAKASKAVKACLSDSPHGDECKAAICETAGAFWRFAGLDPSVKWEKKTRRPWNADLKTLCWKAGQSFMKLRASENDFYGGVYEKRKAYEVERNESGGNTEAAATQLKEKRFGQNQTRDHLEAGRLSPGQIDARARRYAVKLFLSHLHHVMYEDRFGKVPPKPFVISQLEHAHYIRPPNWPVTM